MKWQVVVLWGAAAVAVTLGNSCTMRSEGQLTSVEPAGEVQQTANEKERVTLSEEKLRSARIVTKAVALQSIPDCRTVPGRLQYDDRRHVKVQLATNGVVVKVEVKPGDRVAAGQALAVISSPEVGEVRAEVLKRKAEFEIAQRKFQWESNITANLPAFVAAIQQRPDVNELQRTFHEIPLGEYREKLVTAYARFVLAESVLKGANSVSATGVLASRMIQERTSERQAAEAALLTACELATFDSQQRLDVADLSAKDAQRRWEVSRHHLRALLGYEADAGPDAGVAELSQVELRAPISGTIEQRKFSNSERVQPNDELLVIADTSILWMVADIREQDWAAIGVKPGTAVAVRVPAIPDRTFSATVHFVGREVSPSTNAVSIVAEIDNRDGMLRPGQFVQATLTVGVLSPELTVPAAAVVSHERRSFVFVQEREGTYRRANVEIGRQSDDWVVIRSGLKEGDMVVVEGAFVLKSELLLEPEE